MAFSVFVLGIVAVGICGLIIAAIIAAVWVILEERKGRP